MNIRTSQPGSRGSASTSKTARVSAVLEVAGYGNFRIDKILTVGRAPGSDVVLDAASVSRRHAQILCEAGEYWIEDLGSVNGSTVNGKTVKRALLSDRVQITFGGVKAVFHIGGEAVEPVGRSSLPQRKSDSGIFQKRPSGRSGSISGIRSVEEAARRGSQAGIGASEAEPAGNTAEAGVSLAQLRSLREENERLRRTVKQLERQLADTNLRLRNLQALLDKEVKR